jgi:hypothetical protein
MRIAPTLATTLATTLNQNCLLIDVFHYDGSDIVTRDWAVLVKDVDKAENLTYLLLSRIIWFWIKIYTLCDRVSTMLVSEHKNQHHQQEIDLDHG